VIGEPGDRTDRPIVLFLDEDAQQRAQKAQQALQAARSDAGERSRGVLATLPEGKSDVGECSREEAWKRVARSLKQPFKKLMRQLN